MPVFVSKATLLFLLPFVLVFLLLRFDSYVLLECHSPVVRHDHEGRAETESEGDGKAGETESALDGRKEGVSALSVSVFVPAPAPAREPHLPIVRSGSPEAAPQVSSSENSMSNAPFSIVVYVFV